jgi:hypothetical protein
LDVRNSAPLVNRGDWAIERRIKLSRNLAVSLTIGPHGAVAEWDPDFPHSLSPTELRRYRNGRDRLVRQVAARMGGRAIIGELGPGGVINCKVVEPQP